MLESETMGRQARRDSDTADDPDPVIEEYEKHVDRTLLRENLRRTPDERVRELVRLQLFAGEVARAGAGRSIHDRLRGPAAGSRPPAVEFLLIGGMAVAARAHGSARLSQDLDVVYSRAPDDVERLIQVKRAAGRPKDPEAIAELEALREERDA